MTPFNWKNKNSPTLLLGLCPLLGVTDTLVKSFSIGLATGFVLILSGLAGSALRAELSTLTRLPVLIIVIAGGSMLVDFGMQVYAYPLYKSLGMFVPLIAANPLILSTLITPPELNPVSDAGSTLQYQINNLVTAYWFLLSIVTVGAVRELLANGAILADLHLILPVSVEWKLVLIEDYRKYLFMLAAPGAFITVGFLLVLKNIFSSRFVQARAHSVSGQEKRVRIHL